MEDLINTCIEPKSSGSIFDGRVVTFAVGPEKAEFVVHDQVIGLFRKKLCASLLNESNTESFVLAGCDPDIFHLFVKWAYVAKTGSPGYDHVFASVSSLDLVKLYAFAQEFHVDILQNAVASVVYYRLEDNAEDWSALGFNTDLMEYLALYIGPAAHMHTLVTRALAYQMLPDTAKMPKGLVSPTEWAARGGRGRGPAGRYGRGHCAGAAGFKPAMSSAQYGHGGEDASFDQYAYNLFGAPGRGEPAEAKIDDVLDKLPAVLLRSAVKELRRMISYGLEFKLAFHGCVGYEVEFLLECKGENIEYLPTM